MEHECCDKMMHHEMMKNEKMKIDTGDHMADMMVEMSTKAWESLMMEKMKTHIEKLCNVDGSLLSFLAHC